MSYCATARCFCDCHLTRKLPSHPPPPPLPVAKTMMGVPPPAAPQQSYSQRYRLFYLFLQCPKSLVYDIFVYYCTICSTSTPRSLNIENCGPAVKDVSLFVYKSTYVPVDLVTTHILLYHTHFHFHPNSYKIL